MKQRWIPAVASVAVLFVICLAGVVVLGVASDFLLGTQFIVPRSLWPTPQDEYFEIARSKVQEGDSRESALLALSDSWYHGVCTYGDHAEVDDLLFIGPRDPRQVTVVLLRSEVRDGQLTVYFVGQIDSYQLDTWRCVPDDIFP